MCRYFILATYLGDQPRVIEVVEGVSARRRLPEAAAQRWPQQQQHALQRERAVWLGRAMAVDGVGALSYPLLRFAIRGCAARAVSERGPNAVGLQAHPRRRRASLLRLVLSVGQLAALCGGRGGGLVRLGHRAHEKIAHPAALAQAQARQAVERQHVLQLLV